MMSAYVIAEPRLLLIKAYGPVFDIVRPAGFKVIYLGTLRAWSVDRFKRGTDRLADLVAVLEAARYTVRVTEHIEDVPAEVDETPVPRDPFEVKDGRQMVLFAGGGQ